MTVEEFFEWEKASRDTIDLKRCYVDIAGDLVSGLLLSQIIYWFLPGEHGQKLRVEKEGLYWLAKGRTEWWEECRISPKQFDRAIKILQDKGLVKSKRFRWKGSPTVHIYLEIETLLEGINSNLTKGENPIQLKVKKRTSQKGKIEVAQKDKSLTETTTKTNIQKTTNRDNGDKPHPNQVKEVFIAMKSYYGYPDKTKVDPIPSYGKEGKAIKNMLDRGFTTVQILDCWIAKCKKANMFKSMVYVNEDIYAGPIKKPGSKYDNQKHGGLVQS